MRSDTPVSLRPATAADANLLLRWRNDPDTRESSFNTGAVATAEHERWLAGKLADSDCRLWIVEVEGEAVGQVRLDRRPTQPATAEISIAIAPEHRGRGLATPAIRAALRQVAGEGFVREVVAQVKRANERSLAAFARAGFSRRTDTGNSIVLVAGTTAPPDRPA